MFRFSRGRLPALLSILALLSTSCGRQTTGAATDITNVMPPLAFHMTRVNDGLPVSAASYRGKVVVLYFGYTHCPDECPTTLANLAAVLRRLGTKAQDVRVLFVSVDPSRDTSSILKSYVQAFAPQIDGLLGSDNAIAILARRYRVIYAVTPASPGHPYTVVHSGSTFFFDRDGNARQVTMSTDDTAAITAQVRRLLES